MSVIKKLTTKLTAFFKKQPSLHFDPAFSNFMTSKSLLEVSGLNVWFNTSNKRLIHIVRGVDLNVRRAEIVGLVGESGSGKSVTVQALLGLNEGAQVKVTKLRIDDLDFTNFRREREWLTVRGRRIGYIPQDPLTSLNPTRTIGKQLLDALPKKDERFSSKSERKSYLINLLESFGIKNAAAKFNSYPHTFSGGMKQRVVIAMIVAAQPDLIVADEPTTALDPSVQTAVLALFEQIRTKFRISIIFISHNISVVAKFCDYIYVMYAGRVVEKGPKKLIFTNPQHPYTWALISSIPEINSQSLYTIRGTPPDMANLPLGDPFAPRSDYAIELDFKLEPPLFEVNRRLGHFAATWLLHPLAPKIKRSEVLETKLQLFKDAFNE